MALANPTGMPDLQVSSAPASDVQPQRSCHHSSPLCSRTLCGTYLRASPSCVSGPRCTPRTPSVPRRPCVLQLRMSKKIAQLTKVIYHLNSRTEDHEAELQELSDQHEQEVEQILRDTHEKISFYKAQLEDARDERHLAEVARVSAGDSCKANTAFSRTPSAWQTVIAMAPAHPAELQA